MGSGQQPSACKNRLIDETSPYLRQHAHNPVAWYPWGEDALRLARELNRPIFLSIGYSACHWCHVMAHESFEDPEVGQILNDHFISIKVDREERPDLDQIYMTAVQILSGQGGWPMSVFLTPDLQPFFAGTYFPPDDRHGRPSFKRLLRHLAQAWQEHHDVVVQQVGQLTDHLQEVLQPPPASGQLKAELLHHAARQLRGAFDSIYGGFGQAPKFPHPMDLRLLLRSWRRFGDDDGLAMVRTTLDHMARGGLYDHLGGGFHRYSTDARWLVPHFEKMLYDNALLTQVNLEAYQATGDLFYREIIEETIAYVLREMTSPQGPFYSTQDADSEGEEGKYFVWSLAEIEAVLGKKEAALFAAVYDVTAEGNWEGQNILNRARPFEQEAKLLNISEVDMRCRLEESRRKLLEVRERRVRPGRDEKVLTAWNGLMIAAMADAGAVLNKPAWLAAAARAADFLLTHLRSADGRLLRTYSFGAGAKLNGYQEDYACLIDSLVSLYEATFEPRWLEAALDLLKVMQEQFWDRSFGGFFYTGKDHERLIARTKDVYDSSLPSGNGVAALALTRLGKLTGRQDLLKDAECIFTTNHTLLAQAPRAVGQLLLAFDFFLGPIQEWAIVGDPQAEETREVIRALRREFLPHRVLALQALGDESAEKLVPLLAGKQALGAVTTYLCEDFTCRQPVVGAAAVREVLGRLGK